MKRGWPEKGLGVGSPPAKATFRCCKAKFSEAQVVKNFLSKTLLQRFGVNNKIADHVTLPTFRKNQDLTI